MNLFKWIAVAYVIFYSNYFFATYACPLRLPYYQVWLLRLQKATPQTLAEAIAYITTASAFFQYFGLYLSLSLFYCLTADLVLMI